MTKTSNFSKDQIQKIVLSGIGLVALLYVYFNFFLGPLNKNRASMEVILTDLQTKLGSSKNELAKANNLERQAGNATTRYAAMQALAPEGAPIAWFPPRIKAFFSNQRIDKVVARLDSSTSVAKPGLEGWLSYSWLINVPQAEFSTFGNAIAELENAEPLLAINKITIHASSDQPQFQQIELVAANVIQDK